MRKKIYVSLILLVMSVGLISCGGAKQLIDATVDLTGIWTVTEMITEASGVCSDNVGNTDTYTLDVWQDGNDLEVTVGDDAQDNAGETFYGTVSGDEVEWTGSYPTSGGTTTITSMNVKATDNSFSGTANWSWTDGDDSCTGKTQVQGYKQ